MTHSSGLHAWVLQRFTAVYVLGYLLYFATHLVVWPPEAYEPWRDWITATPMAVATELFFLALLLHIWVGLRDVLMDYVQRTRARLALLGGIAAILLMLGLWVFRVLWKGGA